MIDKRRWSSKPSKYIPSIVNNAETVSMALEELADNLVHGASFRPGILVGGKGAANWKQQQVFALDIEHSHTIEAAYEKSISLGLVPCFIYTSFSHTEEDHRFRMVYCADRVITDGDIRDRLQLALMNAIGGCDSHCTDRNRVFFGGGSGTVLYPDYDARLDVDEVISKYYSSPEKPVKIKPTVKRLSAEKSATPNVELIAKLDVEGMKAAIQKNRIPCTDEECKSCIQCEGVLAPPINEDLNNIFINRVVKNPPEIHLFNSRAELYSFID